jgi:serine-protein kinase ATM
VYVAESRVEKPSDIISKYLMAAISELNGNRQGSVAGDTFHAFASYCDNQLNSQETNDDIQRVRSQTQRKQSDAREFERLAKEAKSKDVRDVHKRSAHRALKWAEIDMKELQQLLHYKDTFLRQSLENYLLALKACDLHDRDVLRVFALWLEYSETPQATEAINSHLFEVPTSKFTVLMNQLSSRLLDEKTEFQQMLSKLVYNICVDHPYHGMHQIFAGALSLGIKDDAARSRNAKAKELSSSFLKNENIALTWFKIRDSNRFYHEFATMPLDKEQVRSANRKLTLDKVHPKITHKIPELKVPPATMTISVRKDKNYSRVPVITRFRSSIVIAGGLSAPKIVSCIASNGLEYRALVCFRLPHKNCFNFANDCIV